MGRFLLSRLAGMAIVLVVVSWLVFLVFAAVPNGDPAQRMAGRGATQVQIEAIRREWGFDRNLVVQYGETMKRVATGELVSYTDGTNVMDEIARGAPRTLALAGGAALLWLAVGVAAGLYGAARAGRPADGLLTVLALAAMSLPVFWLASLLSHYLGYRLGWFPDGGYVPIGESAWGWAHHLLLPWAAMALFLAGVYARVVRATVLDVMDEDFVRTARAKGVGERQVMVRHVLRAAALPIVTLWGLDLAAVLVGGAVLVESAFDLQGVGQYFAGAIGRLDVPPVLGVTLLAACVIVVLNTVVDVATALLDPRTRSARAR